MDFDRSIPDAKYVTLRIREKARSSAQRHSESIETEIFNIDYEYGWYKDLTGVFSYIAKQIEDLNYTAYREVKNELYDELNYTTGHATHDQR